MPHPNQQHIDWFQKYYGQLAGATIEKIIIGIDDEFGDVWPSFEVKLENGSTVEITVQADEEGNGPGFIRGLPLPGPSEQNEPAKHPRAGDSSYFARMGALLFDKHGAKVGKVSDDRDEAALIKINNDRETVRIGEDTGYPGTYLVDLIVGDDLAAEPTLLLPHLSEGDVIEKVTALIEGDTKVRDAEMLKYAEVLLADQDAGLWHSGGGIDLIAGFYGDYRITARSDYTELSTYGLEVVHETEEGTESVLHKEGLTPSQLVNLWSEERKKLAEGDNKQ